MIRKKELENVDNKLIVYLNVFLKIVLNLMGILISSKSSLLNHIKAKHDKNYTFK